ncbi:unnamed protein product [Miscanthus lutarioriparius]|uniref:Gnk2-homologous domain-containing protein n=1 Tax=Miscanthus lutarioriparius TaxID=422564 RepID=A0A811MY27_9POAL|nr:unnamed protein product [Miscanthus lutarioriparius]
MERPKPSVVVPALILLVLVMAAEPGIAFKLEPTGTSSHMPPLLDCAPAPVGAAPSNNLSAFRGNVLALLGALPAAAPTGFVAAAQSGGAVGDDRAFARAFCFGERRGSSPSDCLKCLAAAAQDVADGCHGRRGAVWRAGCFLWYADTNASTAREDAWRGWFYDDDSDDTLTAALGTCVANCTAAECSRCLNESAQVVPALKEGRRLSLVHGDVVVVVGYSCYLRVPLSPPKIRWPVWVNYALGILNVVGVLLFEIGGILCCIRIARQFNLAAA